MRRRAVATRLAALECSQVHYKGITSSLQAIPTTLSEVDSASLSPSFSSVILAGWLTMTRYFCHECALEDNDFPTNAQGPVCPRCQGAFVEEVRTPSLPHRTSSELHPLAHIACRRSLKTSLAQTIRETLTRTTTAKREEEEGCHSTCSVEVEREE